MTTSRKQAAEIIDIFDDESIAKELDTIEKKLSLVQSVASRQPDSTGLLSLDLILSGGITPGSWTTFFGGEQSAKSTLAMTILNMAAMTDTKRLFYCDYEGSFSDTYFEAIGGTMGSKLDLLDIFGVKDDKGSYIKMPKVRYYSSQVGEEFFDLVYKLESTLPDKLQRDGKWWYVFDKTYKDKYNEIMNKQYFRETGRVWVEAPDGRPQALFVVDSYPAMLPRGQDEEDPGNSLASQARMFSAQIKRVKGRMRQKMITVIGVNQLRKVPMAMYGPPEAEPCGEALKFNCCGSNTLLQTGQGLLTAKEYAVIGESPILGSKGLETPSLFGEMGYSQLYRATTDLGNFIDGKPDHKVMVVSSKDLSIVWKSLQDLDKDTSYYVPLKIGEQVWPEDGMSFDFKQIDAKAMQETIPSKNSKELSAVLGLLCGHSTIDSIRGNIFFTAKSKEAANLYSTNFKEVFGLVPGTATQTNKTGEEVFIFTVNSPNITHFIEYLGMANFNDKKSVPLCVRVGTMQEVSSFLQALFVTDTGSSYPLVCPSKSLALEVQQLLFNFGIISKVSTVWTSGSTGFDVVYYVIIDITSKDDFESRIMQDGRSTFDSQCMVPTTFDVSSYSLPAGYIFNMGTTLATIIGQMASGTTSFAYRLLTKSWFQKLRKSAEVLDGVEKDAVSREIDILETFVSKTLDNNWVWTRIDSVKYDVGCDMTYDANMPETSTIVTGGIVSHNSDVRIRLTGRSNPNGKGAIEEEPGISGGVCQYRYVYMKAQKNKLSTPNLEGWARIWIKDEHGEPHGFDPVYDTFMFLKECSLIEGTKNRLKIFLPAMNDGNHKGLTWLQFKTLILGSNSQIKDVLASVGVEKPFHLRRLCFRMFERGKDVKQSNAMRLYFDAIKEKSNSK